MTTPVTTEARFLQNQQARCAAIKRSSKQHDAIEFWKEYREKVQEWKFKLNAIADQQQCEPKQQEHYSFEELEQQLKNIQRQALENQELPISDLAVLHKELGGLHDDLKATRNLCQPAQKFRFRRYRAAWKVHSLEKVHKILPETLRETDGVIETDPSSSSTPLVCPKSMGDNCIQNLSRSSVVLQQHDQHVYVNDKRMFPIYGDTIVLYNLDDCQVSLDSTFQLVHIVNVTGSTIDLSYNVGAIHVTQCVSTNLQIRSCHQLRLHECCELQISLRHDIQAGAIMEDCQQIDLVCENSQNCPRINDFNWFRTDEPSPNYTVTMKQRIDGSVPQTKQQHGDVPKKVITVEEHEILEQELGALDKGEDINDESDDEL